MSKWYLTDESHEVLFEGPVHLVERAYLINAWSHKALNNMFSEKQYATYLALYKRDHVGKLSIVEI